MLILSEEINSLSELEAFAQVFCQQFLKIPRKVFFYGEMGAGKTTFIKMLCNCLGVKEKTSSPTFALVNQYQIANSPIIIHHADLYRLESGDEAFNAGLEELFFDKNYLFVEWPQFVEQFALEDTLVVLIESEADKRVIQVRSLL